MPVSISSAEQQSPPIPNPVTSDFTATSLGGTSSSQPAITPLADGNFVISWTSNLTTGFDQNGSGTYAQIFTPTGGATTGEFLLHTITSSSQSQSELTALDDGGFMAVWQDSSTSSDDPSSTATRGQRFDADGNRVGSEFLINDTTNSAQFDPEIAVLGDGRVVVTWTDNSGELDSSGSGIVARIIDPRDAGILGTNEGDVIYGRLGDTVIDGLDGDDILIGMDGDDILNGDAGNDTINGGGGDDTISGGSGNDIIDGGEGFNIITAGSGNDQVVTGAGEDQINTGSGNDTLLGGASGDLLNGGLGNDTVLYSGSNLPVFVRLFNQTAFGGHANDDTLISIENATGSEQNDDLIGSIQANVLDGGAGDDTINGFLGDDIIIGGAGADNLDGGDGIDTVSYVGSTAAVFVRLFNNSVFGGDANGDTIVNFENVTGSSNNDDLIGSIQANVLDGGAGDDTIDGFVGDDIIIGGAGADNMDGGDGVDTLSYASSGSSLGVFVRLFNNSVFGGDANGDVIVNFENVVGTSNNDDLIGSIQANVLDGGAGDDTINGFIGDDTLIGGSGNDLVIGGRGVDNLDGGDGIDTVSYAGSSLGVFVRLFNDSAFGGDANGDTIVNFENATGSSNNDDLIGSVGANTLDGSAGADKLNGFDGNDILIGGGGDDLFVFTGTSGSDTITDFTAGAGSEDKIDLQSSVFTDISDVLANTTDDGLGNTVINKSGVSIRLDGVLKAQLHEDDFVFASNMSVLLQGQLQGSVVPRPDVYNIAQIDGHSNFGLASLEMDMGDDGWLM